MEINEYIICNNISDVCYDAICVDIMGFISKGTKKAVKMSQNPQEKCFRERDIYIGRRTLFQYLSNQLSANAQVSLSILQLLPA